MKRAIPWGVLGFGVGIAAGFTWAATAATPGPDGQSKLSKALSTDWNGGVFSVKVNTITAAKSGVPDLLAGFLERAKG